MSALYAILEICQVFMFSKHRDGEDKNYFLMDKFIGN